MKSMLFCLAVGATFAVSAVYCSCTHAAELPARSVCNIISELAYDNAVAVGDPLPDGAYERAQGDCEWSADFGDSYHDAMVSALAEQRYGVDQVAPGVWLPTTAAEDALADALSTDDAVFTCTNTGCVVDQ